MKEMAINSEHDGTLPVNCFCPCKEKLLKLNPTLNNLNYSNALSKSPHSFGKY